MKTWTQTCKPAWGRWHWPQCCPEETPMAASPALSCGSSDSLELCRFVCLFSPCL
ncbi:unnamed protein product [Nyctereutes procyonoides]|uniref:(raccoon dog) hypothetical protein n=1 Tax=Nyctereutes procyonoides TaxID=34880 RepID=A0A811Y2Z7_NYCPR|nr:unnamed protein product [Nyctereutes procyonoides]